MTLCTAITKDGSQCQAAAGESGYCFTHDPEKSADRAEARKLGGFNRRTAKLSGCDPVEIVTPADVVRLVNAVIADTWLQENSATRSRALLACGELAVKALQAGEIDARLQALEGALKMREG